MLRQVEIGVAVAQEAVVVLQGVAVDLSPLLADERGNEQQECALRLVEIGDDALDHAGFVGGQDDEAGGTAQQIGLLGAQMLQDGL